MPRPTSAVPGTKLWWRSNVERRNESWWEPTPPFFTATMSASGQLTPGHQFPALPPALETVVRSLSDRRLGESLLVADLLATCPCYGVRMPTVDVWWFSPWTLEHIVPHLNLDPLEIACLQHGASGGLADLHAKDAAWYMNIPPSRTA